jgi:hypothetical protein
LPADESTLEKSSCSVNLSLAQAMVNTYDEALLSRMIQIEFPTIPQVPHAGLKRYLHSQTSALINWAFAVSKEMLEKQVRGTYWSSLVLAQNPYVEFITFMLRREEKGFVSNAKILAAIDESLKLNGVPSLPSTGRRRAPHIIFSLLSRDFNCSIKKGREKGVGARGLHGVRLKRNNETAETDPENLFLRAASSFTDIDPFEKHPLVSYSSLENGIDPFIKSDDIEE